MANYKENSAVEARSVGIKFTKGRKRDDIRSVLFNLHKRTQDFWALREIDFSWAPGDVIGIIGFNGAGKSTLCRVISKLLVPDEGAITVKGEVSALLSLGTGFNKDLTGNENIYLNGMMLGFSRKHMDTIYQDIVEFSGLGDFIDQPIKYYSSGMRARLGFSIATMLQPEILVLDEALSTGDAEFNAKAMARTKEMVKKAKMVVIVSHDINFIRDNCTKVIWIEQGKLKTAGDPQEVCPAYQEHALSQKNLKPPKRLKFKQTTTKAGDETVIQATNLGLKFNLDGKDFWALRDCSFTVKQGEIVGIIGPNGAGKSTLCRILSGILKPDTGSLTQEGEVSALLSLGSGFNIQLSGRDNIYLNGLMLGIPKRELETLVDEIIDFSGLEEFIDEPIKNYSSGMVARLGFSIAAMLEPDIFIIDEALSTGDMTFYEKASARIQEMINSAKAVIVVTHSMAFVKKVCTKAIWLKQGQIMHMGDPVETVELYTADSMLAPPARNIG